MSDLIKQDGSDAGFSNILETTGISEEDRREIISEIDQIVEENKIPITKELFKIKPRKKGIFLPILINLFAVAVVAAVFFFAKTNFENSQINFDEETNFYLTGEGALLKQIQEENDRKLQEKQDQIDQFNDLIGDIEADRKALEENIDSIVTKQREKLETEMGEELERQRIALTAQLNQNQISQTELDSIMEKATLKLNAERETELAKLREEESAKREKDRKDLEAREAAYKQNISNSEQALLDLEAKNKADDETRKREHAEELKKLESQASDAETEIKRLNDLRIQEENINNQIMGTYNTVIDNIKGDKFEDALEGINNLKTLYNDNLINKLPSIAQRKTTDLFILDSLQEQIELKGQIAKIDTSDITSMANTLVTTKAYAEQGVSEYAEGNIERARTTLQQATKSIPEIYDAYTTLQKIETKTKTEIANDHIKNGSEYFSQNALAKAVSSYQNAAYVVAEEHKDELGKAFEGLKNVYKEQYKIDETEKDNQITDLAKTINTKDNEITALQSVINQKDTEITKLSSDNTKLEAQLVNRENTSTGTEAADLVSNEQLTNLQNQVTEKNVEITDLTDKLNSKKQELAELDDELGDRDSEILDITAQLAGKDNDISDKDTIIRERNTAITNLTNSINDLNSQIEAVKLDTGSANEALISANQEISTHKQTITDKDTEIEGNETEINSLNNTLSTYITQLEEKTTAYETEAAKNAILAAELLQKESSASGTKEDFNAALTTINSYQQQIDTLTQDKNTLSSEIDTKEDTINELNTSISKKNDEINTLTDLINSAETDSSSASIIAEKESAIKQLNTNLQTEKNKVSNLETENDNLENENSNYQSTISNLNSDLSTLSKEKSKLQTNLAEAVNNAEKNLRTLRKDAEDAVEEQTNFINELLNSYIKYRKNINSKLETNSSASIAEAENLLTEFLTGNDISALFPEFANLIQSIQKASIDQERKEIESRARNNALNDVLIAARYFSGGDQGGTSTTVNTIAVLTENEEKYKEIVTAFQNISTNAVSSSDSSVLSKTVSLIGSIVSMNKNTIVIEPIINNVSGIKEGEIVQIKRKDRYGKETVVTQARITSVKTGKITATFLETNDPESKPVIADLIYQITAE